jgi:integrase
VSLFKRGDVFWSQFYLDGIRYQQTTGARTRRLAEQIERKLREDANLRRHDVINADPDVTFGKLAAKFIANGAKPFHLDRLKHLLPYFADLPAACITKGIAADYRSHRHQEKSITDATLNRDLACLRRILFWALDEGMILKNPLTRLKLEQERKVKARVLGILDEEKLLRVAAPHLRRMIITALYTGMRRGEILHQQWEHVDFDRQVLYVTRSKTAGGEARELPLARTVLETLLPIRKTEGFVFDFRGKQINTYKTAWQHATSRAIPYHLRFHDLRHSCNTRMMEAGVIQDVRKAILGHSSGREINARYTHVELPAKREAIHKLELWVEEQRTQLIEQHTKTDVEREEEKR